MRHITLTPLEVKWLRQRGGRSIEDVKVAESGRLYVRMGDGHHGFIRIYLDTGVRY